MFTEAPDAQKIATLQQQLVQAQSDRLTHEIAVQPKVAAVLTADQRAKVRERLSQAPADGRGGFERRGADDRRGPATGVNTDTPGGSPTPPAARIQAPCLAAPPFACVWIVGLLTIALRGQQAGDPEQRPPTFRTGTNVVRVDVSVLDRDGKPVRSLTQDDFELRENGELQSITSFKLVDADGQPTDDLSLPDPLSPARRHRSRARRRADVRISGTSTTSISSAARCAPREQLTNFVLEAFGPTDLVALMDQLTPISALRFTRDRRELANQVHNLRGRRGLYVPARRRSKTGICATAKTSTASAPR